jgi:catechol 2,3-dioxygenase-like lactoylglutathione lyase family enzyme
VTGAGNEYSPTRMIDTARPARKVSTTLGIVQRLEHVGLTVTDVERTVAWYATMFGSRRVQEMNWPETGVRGVYVTLGDDGSQLEIFQKPGTHKHLEPDLEMARYEHFCIQVEDIHATFADLDAKGAEIAFRPRLAKRHGYVAMVVDPDGIRIELLQILSPERHAELVREQASR